MFFPRQWPQNRESNPQKCFLLEITHISSSFAYTEVTQPNPLTVQLCGLRNSTALTKPLSDVELHFSSLLKYHTTTPFLSTSLFIGPSACPTENLAYVAKLLAAIWVKYSLSNALDMWGELLLCSSFCRKLTKSSYCVSYFFLLLRTLYFISSYSETVAGSCPTLVLLKRENNAKRGCPWRTIMPCSHMQVRFFFSRTATSQEHDCCSCPWKQPSFPCSPWKLGFHYCKGSWVLIWKSGISKELLCQCTVAWHARGGTHVRAVGNKVEGKGQFLLPCPVWIWTVSDGWEGTCTDSE